MQLEGEEVRVAFMIIGAQKSGTTSLAHQLAQHPQVCFCCTKEPGYFNRVVDWRSGLSEYHALFAPTTGQLCGEGSTMYTFLPEWQDTHRRLHEYNPALKLVYIMRHPVERIVSHYSFRFVRARVKESPEVAVRTDPTYVDRSRYGMQLGPYLALFGRAQILPLIFEEYTANPRAVLEEVARFLEIAPEPMASIDTGVKGATAGNEALSDSARKVARSRVVTALKPLLPSKLRGRVRRMFSKRLDANVEFPRELKTALWTRLEPEVAQIETMLGRRLDVWRNRYAQR